MTAQNTHAAAPGARIDVPLEKLRDFCARWRITEFAFVDADVSVACGPGCEVDALVRFEPEAQWSLLDLVQMEHDFEACFGCALRHVERRTVEGSANALWRASVLHSLTTVPLAG